MPTLLVSSFLASAGVLALMLLAAAGEWRALRTLLIPVGGAGPGR
ncbi:hypothetical protein [Hymenobacter nivis]|nr:hypothetical protein [Hymenobacter nivis]